MNNKRISVFGSYNKNSIGDKAILIGLLDLLFSQQILDLRITVIAVDVESIVDELRPYCWSSQVTVTPVFREITQNTVASASGAENDAPSCLRSARRFLRERIPANVNVLVELLRSRVRVRGDLGDSGDLLIIGGGNLLMDMFLAWPSYLYAVSFQFKRLRKPILLAGVGAFPFRSCLGTSVIKRIIKMSECVLVRDTQTANYASQVSKGRRVTIHPDFALCLPFDEACGECLGKDRHIAINIGTIYYPDRPQKDELTQARINESLANAFHSHFLRNHGRVVFEFFDTNFPTDSFATESLIQRLIAKGIPKGRLSYAARRALSVRELLELLQEADFAVTTRLHATLLALRAGTATVAIAYQAMVRDVLSYRGMTSSIVDLQQAPDNIGNSIKEVSETPAKYRLSKEKKIDVKNRNQVVAKEILGYLR